MSNILATFLREISPHVGAHFWVRLPVDRLPHSWDIYTCVLANEGILVRFQSILVTSVRRTKLHRFCVNHLTHRGIFLRTRIVALVCRRVVWPILGMGPAHAGQVAKHFCDIYVVVWKGLAYAGHEPEAFLGFICGFACKCCKYDSKHSCNIFARDLSAFRGIFLGYLCSSFQNVICVKVSTRKPTQNCTDQKLTFVVLGHVTYLYFCVHTFCVNISTGHAARPAHGDPICCVCTFCVGVPRGYPAYLINGDRIAKAFSGYSSQFTNWGI